MSAQTTRTINLNAVDKSTATWMGMVRMMRAVGQEIRVLTMLMTALSVAEDEATFGAGTLSRIFRLGLLGVAGGLSVYTAAQITQQGNIVPVGQTMPGQFRNIVASGRAWVDKGETIFTPPQSMGGGGMGGQQISVGPVYISNEGLPPDQAWQRVRTRLRTMAFGWPR